MVVVNLYCSCLFLEGKRNLIEFSIIDPRLVICIAYPQMVTCTELIDCGYVVQVIFSVIGSDNHQIIFPIIRGCSNIIRLLSLNIRIIEKERIFHILIEADIALVGHILICMT